MTYITGPNWENISAFETIGRRFSFFSNFSSMSRTVQKLTRGHLEISGLKQRLQELQEKVPRLRPRPNLNPG